MLHAHRFFVGSLLSLSLMTPVFAGVSTVSIKPTNPNSEKPSVFMYEVDPGQNIEDSLLVTNDTDETVLVHLDSVDNAATQDGAFACSQDGDVQSFFGTWLKYDTQDFEMAPREKKAVPFTILVPQDIEVGEHSGCITATRGQDPSKQVLENGVTLNFRNAIGTFLRVKGEIIEKLSLKDFTVKKLGEGRINAALTIQNDGNVFLKATTQLVVKDLFGREISIHEQGGLAMRNKDLSYQFVIGDLEASPLYRLQVKTNYTLKNGDIVALEDKSASVWMIPSLQYLLLYLAVLACFVSLIAYVKTKKALQKKIRNTWVKTEINQSMFIQDLAKEYQLDWNLIAKVNALKAPYQIEKGMMLLLPEKETPVQKPAPVKKAASTKKSSPVKKATSTKPKKKPDAS